MAFLTFGEGFHNYHHKFQWDYRNGIKWYNFDPSKWIIKFLSIFNIAYGLRKASDSSIFRAKIETLLIKINSISILRINSKYQSQINLIKENAYKKIKLLKALELKYDFEKSLCYSLDIMHALLLLNLYHLDQL